MNHFYIPESHGELKGVSEDLPDFSPLLMLAMAVMCAACVIFGVVLGFVIWGIK